MKSIRKHHGHMISLTKTLIMSLKRPIFLSLTTLSFTLIGLSSLGIFFLEAELNPQINTWLDAAYYAVTITTGVGLGDISPMTMGGRLLSMAMMLMGTAIYVTFTASLATVLLQSEFSSRD